MMPTRACRMLLVTLGTVMLIGLARPAVAQNNEEIFQQFQWNFFPPGARASAMGQAFIGIADDASAAVTNPAGLVSLTRPQVYVEFKNTQLENERLAGANSLVSLQPTIFSTDVRSVSFFDVAAPIGGRMTVAFSLHEFLNYEERFQLELRPSPTGVAGRFLAAVDGDVDMRGTTYAGSAAVAVTDMFRVGLTLSMNRLEASTSSVRYRPVASGGTVVSSNIILNDSGIDDSDTVPAWSAGAVLRPRDQVAIGVLYAKGPKFTVTETHRVNPSATQNGTMQVDVVEELAINTPDRLGIGISVRPQSRLLVAFDAVRIQYSQLAEDITPGPFLTGNEFAIDDATEVHLGGEVLAVTGANPVFLRAGVLTNPYHGMKYVGGSPDAATNTVFDALFNRGNNENKIHGTFGAGVAAGRRFQVDLAYVWDRDFVVSAAVRF